MISPKATSPRVTSSSRWYSSCGEERAARRRTRWTSATNRHLLRQLRERQAALGVVGELVEAGAGRRQQHHVSGVGAGRRGGHRGRHPRVAAVRHARGGEGGGDLLARLAVYVHRHDRAGGDGGGQPGEG